MKTRFTKHAQEKFTILRRAGFPIQKSLVLKVLLQPQRVEDRQDGTFIGMRVIDETHVLRVVYREENDTMVVITFYPAQRKTYAI